MAMLSLNDFAAAASLFPIKLFRMVSDAQCHCMSWGGDGEHLVLNTRAFEDELLQQTLARWKYQLKTTSTTSFIRQLHAYGFRKVIEGYGEPNNIRRYFHPYFHRQRPDLLMFMKRSMRSGSAKKHPLRIFEESNKQPVPGHGRSSSTMEQQVALCDKTSSSSVLRTPNQFLGAGEISRPQTETPYKRRRKAQPRRHPSFQDEFQVDEEDSFPPSMVTQPHFRDHKLTPKYPDLTLGNNIARTPIIVKQEIKSDLKDLQDYCTQINKLVESKEKQLPKEPIDLPLQERNNETKNEEASEQEKPTVYYQPNRESTKASVHVPAPATPNQIVMLKKEHKYLVPDEPLDLSKPASSQKPPVVTMEKPPPVSQNIRSGFQQPIVKPMAILNGSSTNFLPANENHTLAPPPTAVQHQQNQSQTFLISSQTPLHQHPGAMDNASKAMSSGLPPFPATSTRISVPPHSVLQPAYIAWPTRGIFCPQTKQWIQSRPTIIPLPLKSQQISPGKYPNARQAGMLINQQPQWKCEPSRVAGEVKEQQTIKPKNTAPPREEPAYHLRSLPRPRVSFQN